MSIIPIVPAVIPSSEAEVREMTKALSFSREFHLDVVDGVFVSSISWPYQPNGTPIAVKPFTDAFTLEVDLMVSNPIPAARAWIQAGADMLVFHVETVDIHSFVDFVEHAPVVSVGVSLHGDTPWETFLEYVPHADYVQLMGIRTIGLQGQPFDESTLEKISRLKQEFPNMPISVDGAVNQATIKKIADAGADRLIVGSAIVKQSDPALAYAQLRSLVNQT